MWYEEVGDAFFFALRKPICILKNGKREYSDWTQLWVGLETLNELVQSYSATDKDMCSMVTKPRHVLARNERELVDSYLGSKTKRP